MKLGTKLQGKVVRMGTKALGNAVRSKLGQKGGNAVQGGLDAAFDAYTGTAGIPSWVPKGPGVTNVRTMQAFYRQRERPSMPPRPTPMINRYVTQNTFLGREMNM
jgi:hypothetical protein